jgi:hypothetical protein
MHRLAIILTLLFATPAFGQRTTPSPSGTPESTPALNSIWRCDLPGGTYEVALRAILSVSSHEYIVDGVARVTEVNVDTQGNMAVRFYCIQPNAPKAPLGIGQSAVDKISDLAKEAAQRTSQEDVWRRVVKSYPTTTHSHTIEYRVESEEQLKKIFDSVENAFQSGRGSTLKLTTQ